MIFDAGFCRHVMLSLGFDFFLHFEHFGLVLLQIPTYMYINALSESKLR
jgi:hypothetical protein